MKLSMKIKQEESKDRIIRYMFTPKTIIDPDNLDDLEEKKNKACCSSLKASEKPQEDESDEDPLEGNFLEAH